MAWHEQRYFTAACASSPASNTTSSCALRVAAGVLTERNLPPVGGVGEVRSSILVYVADAGARGSRCNDISLI